jgi:hypothetical protein
MRKGVQEFKGGRSTELQAERKFSGLDAIDTPISLRAF